MRDKLLRFIDNTIGNFQEVSYAPALYQCMDLVYEWVFVLGFPKSTIQHQYAYEVYTLASDFTRQYFDIIPNLKETIPQEGDIVVWNKTAGNAAGHIGLVIEATQTKMKVFDQNKPLGTNANISDENYTNCLGFLRPKLTHEGGVPQYLKTLAQEVGIDLNNEGQVRSFWEKGRKYDDETKALREQIISTNEALAGKSTELATITEKVEGLERAVSELQEQLNTTRTERDTATWEAEKLEIKNKALLEENTAFKEKNDLMAYSWFTRLFSLFRG